MIIAVDFDGILTVDEVAFPAIGDPDYSMVSFVRELIDQGHEVILWTCRTDDALDAAVKWCDDRGLRFCAINHNAPSNVAKYRSMYPNGTRKVSADIYIDDHSDAFIKCELCYGRQSAIAETISRVRRIIKWKTEEN